MSDAIKQLREAVSEAMDCVRAVPEWAPELRAALARLDGES